MVQVAVRTGRLGRDGHLLCVCGHERNIWHLIDDEGIGTGRCTSELTSPERKQRLCPCSSYHPNGGIQVGPSWLEQAFDVLKWKMRSLEQQQELLERYNQRHPGSSHHGVGRSVDL